jgi:hypothetical protein
MFIEVRVLGLDTRVLIVVWMGLHIGVAIKGFFKGSFTLQL